MNKFERDIEKLLRQEAPRHGLQFRRKVRGKRHWRWYLRNRKTGKERFMSSSTSPSDKFRAIQETRHNLRRLARDLDAAE